MSGRYHANYCTDAKRAMRAIVYERAAEVILGRKRASTIPTDVLMIAGRSPSAEIECARSSLPGCLVTAVDVDSVSVEAARLAGADRAIRLDLSTDRWSDRCGLEYRHCYGFVNLDLCAKLTEQTKIIIRCAARRAGEVLAVWVVYGLDHEKRFAGITDHGGGPLCRGEREQLALCSAVHAGWTDTNIGRLAEILGVVASETRGEFYPFAFGRYFGHHMPLMVVLFRCSRGWDPITDTSDPVDVFDVRDDDLRILATQCALRHGSRTAMRRFDVDAARMAAFMAVHTRQEKKAKMA